MTQFVRFAGCNLRCPGWPCDTQHAIDPKIYRINSTKDSSAQLIDKLAPWPLRITLTGGEPFLQPGGQLQEFCEMAWIRKYQIECFTNGTFQFPAWAFPSIRFIMDWKLPGSGEDNKPGERERNALCLQRGDAIKFTVKDEQDLEAAYSAWVHLNALDVLAQYFVGIVWGGPLTDTDVIDFVRYNKLPWRLNMQLHKYIWNPDQIGV
jgi:7-carboxy-7-deazaguanine synthase